MCAAYKLKKGEKGGFKLAAGPELGFKLRRGQSSLLEVVNVPSLALVSELTVFFLLEKKKKNQAL